VAYLIPPEIPKAEPGTGLEAELVTLERLRTELPASYVVYHGVNWTKGWNRQPVFGEADFVVVNGAGSILVIEQKSGSLEETSDGLFKRYSNGRKSVGSQIHRTLNGLRDKFKRQTGRQLEVDYLLYCPDHRLLSVTAAGLDQERIVDAAKAASLCKIIEDLLPQTQAMIDGDRVKRFFEQRIDLVPDIHARIMVGDKRYAAATGELATTIMNLAGNPLRLAIRGTAGCGKTQVALQLWNAAVLSGRRPLLICFNRDLKEKMKTLAGPGGIVETWYGVIDQLLKSMGEPIDHAAGADWDASVARVAELSSDIPEDWKFDLVIVDEGQDFDPEWRDYLECDLLCSSDADFIWMDDPDQAIQYGREPSDRPWPRKGWVGYHAARNFRSPKSICEYIRALLPEFEFESANPSTGDDVAVTRIESLSDLSKTVGKVIDQLIKRGYRHEDITLISLSGVKSATLSQAEKVGRHILARPTGEYDLLGNQIWTQGKVRFDTIRRFKGQQSPVVILTDVEPLKNLDEKLRRRLLYTALTRATERIEIISLDEHADEFAQL
jgi:hypothetical protein